MRACFSTTGISHGDGVQVIFNRTNTYVVGMATRFVRDVLGLIGSPASVGVVPVAVIPAERTGVVHRVGVLALGISPRRMRMGTATVSMDLLTFLKDWLVQHIMGTDPTYLPYLKPEDKEPA